MPEEVRIVIQVRIFRGDRQYVAERLDLPVVTEEYLASWMRCS
jgi:hypothetical protein